VRRKPRDPGGKQPERFPKRHRKAGEPPPAQAAYPQVLYANMAAFRERGDWQGWMGNATETGDPTLWPEIVRLYRQHHQLRWVTLWHIPFYWKQHSDLVLPLIRQALRDPELLEVALHAAAYFPALVEDVVACLKDPARRSRVRPWEIVRALSRQLGISKEEDGGLPDYPSLGWGEEDPVLGKIQAELRERFSVDMVLVVREH
jgi:hypothetical protein